MTLFGRRLLALLGFTFAASHSAAVETLGPPGGSFFEAFNSLDLTHQWYPSDGWSNGEHQGCVWREENLSVADGRLSLALTKDTANPAEWNCAELQSRAIYGYGTYEVSMRAVAAPGTVSAFFTYIGDVHGRPHDEIDFEFVGRDIAKVQLNFFVSSEGGNEVFVPAVPKDADGFVKLAFEWSQDRIRWFVDGTLVHETAPDERIPVNPSKIYLSFWNGTAMLDAWLASFDFTTQPPDMEVEWVAFTVAGESCRFPASITCGSMPE
ncbi:family 16 glycosylhydrolase [Mesorhizobium sp. CAU 1741]|uniref:family 16 glycosylhydrolase n=1 Tax=Mesorhizobium sp. CAU 1741 TaxID=3140366 RepID=UPI00325B2157